VAVLVYAFLIVVAADGGAADPPSAATRTHTVPYNQRGKTWECTLVPLCRRHHEAKRAPGWRLDQPEPGTMIWATPSGRTYTTYPSTYPE
jgi:hypothetical protein